jgi:dynein heavy chain
MYSIVFLSTKLLFVLLLRAEYECFQIELSKNYGMAEWRDDLKKFMLAAGMKNSQTVFLFSDTQVHTATLKSNIFL